MTTEAAHHARERLAGVRTHVALLADAHAEAGLGHLSRSSALALALERQGLATRTLGLGASTPVARYGVLWEPASSLEAAVGAGASASAMVLDSYLPGAALAARDRTSPPLVSFHDGGPLPPGADLVISAGSPQGDAPNVLAGIRYACLGPGYATPARPAANRRRPVVLVTTGGGETGTLGASLAAVFASRGMSADLRVVVHHPGDRLTVAATAVLPQDSLIDELRGADLAVCGGGQTSLEAAALGTPTVALILAENQRGQTSQLAAAGASRVIDPPDPHAAATAVAELLDAPARRTEMSRAARRAVDGLGADRVAEAIARLLRR